MQRHNLKLGTFRAFAYDLASLSTCKRNCVGAIVFPGDFSAVLAIGYNGPAKNRPNDSCTGERRNCGCAHAEANAVAKLPWSTQAERFVMFCTRTPCVFCANNIINCGRIWEYVYDAEVDHPVREGLALLREVGIQVTELSRPQLAVNPYDRLFDKGYSS